MEPTLTPALTHPPAAAAATSKTVDHPNGYTPPPGQPGIGHPAARPGRQQLIELHPDHLRPPLRPRKQQPAVPAAQTTRPHPWTDL